MLEKRDNNNRWKMYTSDRVSFGWSSRYIRQTCSSHHQIVIWICCFCFHIEVLPKMRVAPRIFSSTFIQFCPFHPRSSTFIHFHPHSSYFIQFHSVSSICIHFLSLSSMLSTFIQFHPVSSIFIHFHSKGLPWSVSDHHRMLLNTKALNRENRLEYDSVIVWELYCQ